MTPLERAARALWQRDLLKHGGDPTCWSEARDQMLPDLITEARAVLQAIRIPSVDMLRAGRNATDRDGVAVDHHDIHVAYVAMIDAALEEGG